METQDAPKCRMLMNIISQNFDLPSILRADADLIETAAGRYILVGYFTAFHAQGVVATVCKRE